MPGQFVFIVCGQLVSTAEVHFQFMRGSFLSRVTDELIKPSSPLTTRRHLFENLWLRVESALNFFTYFSLGCEIKKMWGKFALFIFHVYGVFALLSKNVKKALGNKVVNPI